MGERDKLYNDFLQRFPIEHLPNMTLEEYTQHEGKDTFCHWMGTKTDDLGPIFNGFPDIEVISEYEGTPPYKYYAYDDKYTWRGAAGQTSSEVFSKVREQIVQTAYSAQKGDWDAIEALEKSKTRVLGPSFIWKIAFLYSNKQLLPIYNIKEWLIPLAQHFGMPNADKASRMELQRFLLEKKGNKELFQFYEELLEIYDKLPKEQKDSKKENTALVTEGKSTEEHVTVPSPEEVAPQPTTEESLEHYSDEHFLQEVYMSPDDLQRLKALVREKKNIILQGAPGVGKTLQRHFGKTTIHSGNLYQIHTYVMNEDKKQNGKVDGMILYAQTLAQEQPDESFTTPNGNRLMVKTLNLSTDFATIKNYLDNLLAYSV